jgi:hypothetical protein
MFQQKPTILWRLDPYLSVIFLHKSGEAVYRQYQVEVQSLLLALSLMEDH